jgi:hypothetical protein
MDPSRASGPEKLVCIRIVPSGCSSSLAWARKMIESFDRSRSSALRRSSPRWGTWRPYASARRLATIASCVSVRAIRTRNGSSVDVGSLVVLPMIRRLIVCTERPHPWLRSMLHYTTLAVIIHLAVRFANSDSWIYFPQTFGLASEVDLTWRDIP